MRALITGAGGFCGRHLSNYLREQGVEVYSLGRPRAGVNHFYAEPTDVDELAGVIGQVKPDYVFHLAGVARAGQVSDFYKINTLYAAALLEALERAGRQDTPVLLTGTAAEYGRVAPEELPVTEATPTRPYNHYGISKLAQTQMALACANSGRPVVVARPFNIIGEGMPDRLVIKSFARQISELAEGRRPPVLEVGNLEATRDFVDVGDVVRAYWQLIRTPAAYGQVVNVCSGRETLIRDILQTMLEIAGVQTEVRTNVSQLRPDEVLFHYGSTEKLRRLTGVAPQQDPGATLRRILEEALRGKGIDHR